MRACVCVCVCVSGCVSLQGGMAVGCAGRWLGGEGLEWGQSRLVEEDQGGLNVWRSCIRVAPLHAGSPL